MSDIAKKCGVSAMTISYVFNRRAEVSDKTRERVLKVMEEMGYSYNPNASRLSRLKGKAKASTKNIGCVLGLSATKYSDPFFGELIETIERELIDRGYHLMFVHSWTELSRDALLRSAMFSPTLIDGLVTLGVDAPDLAQLRTNVDAIVAVDSDAPKDMDAILSDQFEGGFMATKHLLDLGHKKIAYIGHPFGRSGQDRGDGYCLALKRAGLNVDESLIVEVLHDGISLDGGLKAVKELLARKVEFTAIFSYNDTMACGVTKGLRRSSISVPKDVSVVGYNNDFVAELQEPELTTIDVDKRGMGRLAATQIIKRIQSRDLPACRQILPVKLIIRDTTRQL
jgi:LacI family transcriptional regulator